MQNLQLDQRLKVIQILNPADVSKFWELLKKQRKLEIFNVMSPDQQFNFITS